MLLYHSPVSPFVRVVLMALHEAGMRDRVTLVASANMPVDVTPATPSPNPLAKIPCLVTDTGLALYDSRVICRWIDAEAQAGLYPADRLWAVLTLEALAQGMMEAAVLMVYEARFRPSEGQSAAWCDGQWAKVARALDTLEQERLGELALPVDMGQIALGAALGYLDLRHEPRAWRQGRPGLAEWFAGFSARPSMEQTRPV